ncbi:MAG: hypothetical protein ING75_17005 [Rhodocyclaceae bacterium]|nr:hypothetical protein [Rhodocyclaceae bacterium]
MKMTQPKVTRKFEIWAIVKAFGKTGATSSEVLARLNAPRIALGLPPLSHIAACRALAHLENEGGHIVHFCDGSTHGRRYRYFTTGTDGPLPYHGGRNSIANCIHRGEPVRQIMSAVPKVELPVMAAAPKRKSARLMPLVKQSPMDAFLGIRMAL